MLKYYAEPGADSEFEARKRCWEKYPERMEELYGALNVLSQWIQLDHAILAVGYSTDKY